MMYGNNIDIESLLDKPVWQMTGREFCALVTHANQQATPTTQTVPQRILCRGIHALALHLGCSDSTVYALRRDGVLDSAVVSHIGKAIVFDGEVARELANNHEINTNNENGY